MKLVALDIAILLPPDARDRAIRASAALRRTEDEDLLLDAEHLPHITLTQHFVRAEELDVAFEHVDEVLRGQPPLTLRVTGTAQSGHSVWLAVERTPELAGLHERLMEALRGVERPGGTPAAFFGEEARVADVVWVTSYRLQSSFGAFTPHVTLGHAEETPVVEPFAFRATTVAGCHLGRFCSCRRVLRSWELV